MTFADLVGKADAASIATFGEPVVIRLSGVTVKTVTGIFDESVETVDGYEMERVVFRPQVTLLDADAAGVTRGHTIEVRGVEYRLFGDPRPAAGLTRLLLVR